MHLSVSILFYKVNLTYGYILHRYLLMNYRISDLKNFTEAANCRTLSEASKKLGISQPALSESIKRLESDLGYTLFYRSRAGVQLTSTGQSTLEKAKNAFSAILDVESFSLKNKFSQGRLITIGCHQTIASYFLPSTFKTLEKKSPDYRIQLKHGFSRDIQDKVQKGLIDIGIVVNPISVPDLIIKKIAEDLIYVWSSGKTPIGNKLICNLDLFQTQSILREMGLKKMKQHSLELVETDSIELIVRLVDHQVGYGIIPERAVQLLGAKLKKQKDMPSFKDEICIVYRPEFGKNDYEQGIIDSLKQSII